MVGKGGLTLDVQGTFTCEARATALPAVDLTASDAKSLIDPPNLLKVLDGNGGKSSGGTASTPLSDGLD